MAKKSIRRTKKKFKAEQMRKRMECLNRLPSFMANARFFFDIVDFLGIDANVWHRELGVGVDHKFFFLEDLKEIEKGFHPAFHVTLDLDLKNRILHSIQVEEHERQRW